jgi:predicted transcriptional regulator of viral defense system
MPAVIPNQLPDLLLSRGQHHFTAAEAAELLGSSDDAVRKGLQRLTAARQIISPSRGFYVIVPPEFRSWATVPGSHFIDAMMRHLERRYYVALLSAAELHGASHQAPQVFQVMVDRPLADRDLGRTRLRFFTGRHVPEASVQEHNTPTGTMSVATPELTAVDLVDHLDAGGGLDNVATILAELEPLDPGQLAQLAGQRDRAVARRLGWLLELVDADLDLEPLALAAAPADGAPTDLRAGNPRRGTIDRRWNIRANADVQPDV